MCKSIRRFGIAFAGLFMLSGCGGARSSGASQAALPAVVATGQAGSGITLPGVGTSPVVNTVPPAGEVPSSSEPSPSSGSSTGSSMESLPIASDAAGQSGNVVLTYQLPNAPRSESTVGGASRNLKYIAATNTTLNIGVTPLGGSTTNSSGGCTTVSCTVSFSAAPGPTTLAFRLTDGVNVLSRFDTTVIVQPGILNTYKFSANPVVNSVGLSLASASVNAGTASNVVLTVNARDAANNVIVGTDQYLDASGNPIALSLNVLNNRNGGSGSVSIKSATRITSPNQAATTAVYDGKWLDNAVISVAANRSIAGTLGSTTLTITPYATEYNVPNGPHGLATGNDGNVWFTELAASFVGKITPDGTVTQYNCTPCSQPSFLTSGADGNMWYTEYLSNYISYISPSGNITRVAATASQPTSLTLGPDGNIWYGTFGGSNITEINRSGQSASYATPGKKVRGMTFGPDGNLWYITSNSTVEKRDINGTLVATYAVANTGIYADNIVLAPDGNMWFTIYGGFLFSGNGIGKITPDGTVTIYPIATAAGPRGMILGPDGNLWFTESNAGAIARITTAGVITVFSGAANGITTNCGPLGITLGADGNIWFSEYNSNKIAKFVY